MKLSRNIVKKLKMSEDLDDGYVEATPGERFVMVWEITWDLLICCRVLAYVGNQ